MRILIAPNAFKGTLTAGEAGAAAARGVKRVCGAEVEALRPALGGKILRARVEGPLGEKITARWLLAGRTAVIEMAEASGLSLLGAGRLRPLDATTRGVGQLMAAAARKGAREIIVGLGGSASNDGGAGCAEAFGFGLLDPRGKPIARGARGLAALASVSSGKTGELFKGVKVTGLADVRNPLCGRLGSARVFGPQKGAGPREVEFIRKALLNYARVLKKCLRVDVSTLPGGAAAGGLGAGLAAFFGAGLEDGAAFVLERAGFEKKLAGADLLITGEGCFDRQTFYGKAPGAALAAAARLGKPAIVVCGISRLENKRELGRRGVFGLIKTGLSPSPAEAVEAAVRRDLPALLGLLA